MSSDPDHSKAPMTNSDFFKHMENLACLFSSKVEANIASIQQQQDLLGSDLRSLDHRVVNVEANSANNTSRIEDLQREVYSLKQTFAKGNSAQSSSGFGTLRPGLPSVRDKFNPAQTQDPMTNELLI